MKKSLAMESPFKEDIVRGKVALITGGGSGIGLEISTQFGKHGASIAIMGRRKQVLDPAVSALQSLGIKTRIPYLAKTKKGVGNLALEWGTDFDIQVNGIAQGPISGTPGMSKLAPDEIDNRAREYMPLYKLGDKWDIAMAALYLACDSGKYVNGTTLIIDRGLWLSRPRHLVIYQKRQSSSFREQYKRGLELHQLGFQPASFKPRQWR